MTNYREILRLDSLGFNHKQIADSLKGSRTTVRNTLRRARECGLSYPLKREFTDRELFEHLFPKGEDNESHPQYKMPDYEYIHREMAKPGVTLSLMWVEYCEQCRATNEIPYQSTQFNKYYHDYLNKTKATMHIDRKPGEIMEVDWAGDRAHIIDTDTGEFIDVHIFVAALPYSGYGYVEGFLNRSQESWSAAHVNAFSYFNGAPRILVPDNLKTGVVKNTQSEMVLNKAYQELAEYYNVAVIPCRIKAPKDKPTVEGTVGIVSTWIMAAIRNEQFLSLDELNARIREKLTEFNIKPFQKKDGSRVLALEEEQLFLQPLPKAPFELATWKVATVSFNYHIAVDDQYYSVPYEYIRQKVDVRLTRNAVEVFFDSNRICSHRRLYGRMGQYSTLEVHMPPDHQQYIQWNSDRFIRWAEKIGPNTVTVIEHFLKSSKVEQQGYKACMALLKLADKYTVKRLETACERVLFYTHQPSLRSVQAILKSGQDQVTDAPAPNGPDASQYGFTRGADYYRSGRNDKC
jgi:transposase